MNEQDLRALVRAAIAAHGGAAPSAPPPAPVAVLRQHPSHGVFMLPAGADAEGPCIIEPAVPCTHCGYCKSLGH